MHRVIADHRRAVQIDTGIERIVGIEMQVTVLNLEPAERQRCFHLLQPHLAFDQRLHASSAEMQIHDRATAREISANLKWIFRGDLHVEFPIAQRRLRECQHPPVFRWLRCGSAGQSNRDQIEIL